MPKESKTAQRVGRAYKKSQAARVKARAIKEAAKKGTQAAKISGGFDPIAGAKDLFGILGKSKAAGGGIGKAFGKYPGTMGIGSALILGMILKKLFGEEGVALTNQRENVRRGAVQQQLDVPEEDMYYQAMLPQLSQEREQAQNMLIQAIMGGRGQPMQVPGEVRI